MTSAELPKNPGPEDLSPGLEYFVAGYNLDLEVAADLSSMGALRLGLPSDENFVEAQSSSVESSLDSMAKTCESIERGAFDLGLFGDHEEEGGARRGSRGILSTNESAKALFDLVTRTANAGMTRSGSMASLQVRSGLVFADEARLAKASTATKTVLSRDDFSSLGFTETPGSDPEVARRLREKIAADPAVDLSAFMRTTDRISQIECARYVLEDFLILGNLGPAASRIASEGYEQRIGGLFEDGWSRKLEALEWLSNQFKARVFADSPPYVKATIRALTERNRILREHIAATYRNAYTYCASQNLELPPSIVGPDIPKASVVQPKRAKVVASAAEPKAIESKQEATALPAKPDVMTIADMTSTATEMEGRIRQALGAWRMAGKERAKQGFEGLFQSLLRGFRGADGSLLIAAPSFRGDAEEMVGVLARLRQLANRDSGQNTLERNLASAAELQGELSALRDLAQEAGVLSRITFPRVVRLADHLNSIWANMAGYRQLMIDTWPNGEGRLAADAIEGLLTQHFAPEVESPFIDHELQTDVSKIQEALGAAALPSELRSVAEQLDEIILPPKPTQRDLQEALDSLDAQDAHEEKAVRIEWQRLKDLVEISEQFDGTVYRTKKGTLGNAPPYYVAVFEFEGVTYAVAESPVTKSATFVVSERISQAPWLDILRFPRGEVESLGARRIIHTTAAPHGPDHVKKIINAVFDFATVR